MVYMHGIRLNIKWNTRVKTPEEAVPGLRNGVDDENRCCQANFTEQNHSEHVEELKNKHWINSSKAIMDSCPTVNHDHL